MSAVIGGADVIEAAAVVTEASTLDTAGQAAVRDVSAHAPIHLASPTGAVLGTFSWLTAETAAPAQSGAADLRTVPGSPVSWDGRMPANPP